MTLKHTLNLTIRYLAFATLTLTTSWINPSNSIGLLDFFQSRRESNEEYDKKIEKLLLLNSRLQMIFNCKIINRENIDKDVEMISLSNHDDTQYRVRTNGNELHRLEDLNRWGKKNVESNQPLIEIHSEIINEIFKRLFELSNNKGCTFEQLKESLEVSIKKIPLDGAETSNSDGEWVSTPKTSDDSIINMKNQGKIEQLNTLLNSMKSGLKQHICTKLPKTAGNGYSYSKFIYDFPTNELNMPYVAWNSEPLSTKEIIINSIYSLVADDIHSNTNAANELPPILTPFALFPLPTI